MNHKILKVFSLLLALTLLVVSSGISAVAADIQLPENSDISKLGIQSKIEGNTVTVNLVAAQELYLFMLEGTYVAPAGFTLTGVTSAVLPNFATGNNYVKDGKVVYVDFDVNPDEDAAYAAGTVLMTATYTVAEGTAAGDYTFAFNCTAFLEFADEPFMGSQDIEAKKVHLCKDVATDKDHICDAIGCDAVLNDCVPGSAATCTLPQQCTVCDKVLKDALGHNWGEPAYTVNGDDSHTAKWSCENDGCNESRYETDEHDFTNGDCICGAKNPLTVVYKGAALANAFTVEGNVVTVTFSAACKVGYWDAAAGKYVAISATKIADNTYSFTVPAGVNEVLLVVKGDMNGDGKLATRDYNMLKSAFLKKTLTSVQIFVADVNNDGSITSRECNQLKSACLGKYNYAW